MQDDCIAFAEIRSFFISKLFELFLLHGCDTNSCGIYTLCNNSWFELKHFGVHEDAFVFTSEKMPVFKEIKGYLENRNGKWYYLDYDKDLIESQKLQEFKLDKCQ